MKICVKGFCGLALLYVCVGSAWAAPWIYEETNAFETAVINNKTEGKGVVSNGIWSFGAERQINTQKLELSGTKGSYSGSTTPSAVDFSDVKDADGNSYAVVSFVSLSAYHGLSASALFAYKDMVSEFIAPDCVTLGGNGCFRNCTALTNVVLHGDVVFSGDRPFQGCTALVSFSPSVLNKITTLRIESFNGCSALTNSFELPNCTSLGNNNLFSGCSRIKGIKAPKATIIGQSAFQNCSSLETVEFSSALKTVKNYAFRGCTSLKMDAVKNILHEGITQLGNNTQENTHGIFMDCTGIAGELIWNLPNLATNIVPNNCFSGCTGITKVVFKHPVVEIRGTAFYNLANGAEIYLPAAVPSVVAQGAFNRNSISYSKVYLKDNIEGWIEAFKNSPQHVIEKYEFDDTSWSSSYNGNSQGWSVITTKMRNDTQMCDEEKINGTAYPRAKDKRVVAFVMHNSNSCSWVLRNPKPGLVIFVN